MSAIRFGLLANFTLFCLIPVSSNAMAKTDGCCEFCPSSAPELWVVNSRHAPRCSEFDSGFEHLTYERWDPQGRKFTRETRESFLACQANIPTLLFSHGNSLNHAKAMEICWKVYERIQVCPGPKMLVFWSWPSEILYTRPLIRPIQLARENIRAKYVYAEYQGYYLAKLTSLMSTAQPLTLSGHSFGGLAAICALHYLGGGQLNGLTFESGVPVERPNLRASIISGALDNDHLYPGHRYEQAFVSVEKLHLTYSTKDATLKRWPSHSFRGKEAVGYTGICGERLGLNGHKLLQQEMTADVGRSHYMRLHLASSKMISAICQIAFDSAAYHCDCGKNNNRLSPLGLPSQVIDVPAIMEVPAQILFPGSAL